MITPIPVLRGVSKGENLMMKPTKIEVNVILHSLENNVMVNICKKGFD